MTTPPPRPSTSAHIATGYRPGLIGQVVALHADYYSRALGFGQAFESKVALGLAEFCGRLERPCNRIWLAMDGDRILGSVAIDGEDLGGGIAHLRWFIVHDSLRGTGLGRRMLTEAVRFCDERNAPSTHLWTVRGLDAAVHLYNSLGFELAAEYDDQSWGLPMREMRFERPHPLRSTGPAADRAPPP